MQKKKMFLRLVRKYFTDKSTIGELYINGHFFCYTLEDPVRNKKIKHETAIPAGRYEIIITYSPRFERFLPLLIDVPQYTGIRIHSGNIPEETDGCILVGYRKGQDKIWRSRLALRDLMKRMEKFDEFEIEIINENNN